MALTAAQEERLQKMSWKATATPRGFVIDSQKPMSRDDAMAIKQHIDTALRGQANASFKSENADAYDLDELAKSQHSIRLIDQDGGTRISVSGSEPKEFCEALDLSPDAITLPKTTQVTSGGRGA